MKLALLSLVTVATATKIDEFVDWAKSYGKRYEQAEEQEMRYGIWKANMAKIETHNRGNHSYTLAMNEFGDHTPQEFVSMYNSYHHTQKKAAPATYSPTYTSIPSSKDWRREGAVTEVKDQGQCGSCYSFSATGSLEGQWYLKTGELVSISEQQVVDCSSREGNLGCNGGLMDSVFQYIMDVGGIERETDYSYHAVTGQCKAKSSAYAVTVSGYTDIPSGNEHALTEAIATVGPISVAIDASQFSFQFYSSGVYDEPYCSSSQLDHGVLAVGYGVDNGKDYYLVKNSWGSSWGMNGYLEMSRNKRNQCGIATQASYPVV